MNMPWGRILHKEVEQASMILYRIFWLFKEPPMTPPRTNKAWKAGVLTVNPNFSFKKALLILNC